MTAALLIDFGSTWTKLRVLDIESGNLLGSAQGPSTVATDVNVGLDAALASLERAMGRLPTFAHRLASSSAAGGLRMVTVGLVRELTAEAARQAALGAGARLVGAFAYRLTARDAAEIENLAPDILLLCGGTNGGNSEVILHNAHEEIEHASMVLEWLRRNDKQFDEKLREYLFQPGSIVGREHAVEGTGGGED